MTIEPFEHVDDVLTALARGVDTHDEPGFDVLAHSLQCADLLGREHPDDPELVVAGLLHDLWDAVSPNDHADHEARGAALVEPLFGVRVAELIGGHVRAKRYLVAVDAAYRDALSSRSVATLSVQGDALDATEIRDFEVSTLADALVRLRRADERAKVPGAPVAPLASWRDLCIHVSGR
jgi:predicted HD phosphohydrolase